jgi:hypothetical protein
VSLTSADFDGDGINDLAVGYAIPGGGGLISLQSGKGDAFAPQNNSNTAIVFGVPTVPNFVASGQFLGQMDLVTAAQGDNAVYVFAGNGSGSFASPQFFKVTGPINGMASGRFGSDTQIKSLLIGAGGSQPSVSLYRGSAQGMSLIGTFAVQTPASSFDFDDLDGDGHPDAVMVSGGSVLILHALGPDGSPQMETLSLPFSAVAVVSGFFTHDRGWRRQMAVLDSNSTIHILVHGDFDPQPWASAEIKAMRNALIHGLPNPFLPTHVWPTSDGWIVQESFTGMAPFVAGQVPLLMRTSFFGSGTDEVLAINSQAGQASFISHAPVPLGATTFVAGRQSLLPVSSAPMAAAAMPISVAQSGLIMVSQGSTAPLVAAALTPITFTVNNTTTDTVDAHPGDGVCDDGTNPGGTSCSLRAAVMEVNAEAANAVVQNSTPGPFKISLPKGNIQLTIPGAATTDASTGHLDVNAPVTIAGAGTNATTITQTNPNGDQDRVFLIDALEEQIPGYSVTITGLTITGGHANSKNLPIPQGGAIHWEAGVDGTGSLTLSNVKIANNFATDPADPGVDEGGGLALFNYASTPAAVKISGLLGSIQNNSAINAGGGIALRGAVSLSMTGTTVSGNQALGNGGGLYQEGGGLFFAASNNPVSSPSFIHSSTISGNTAGASGVGVGGGIWTDQSLTINNGSLISGNDAEQSGGGIATDLQGTTEIVAITASTITGNRSAGDGGGIKIQGGSQSNLQLSFNRIFANTATNGLGTGLVNNGNGNVIASDNWWGCNGGPQVPSNGCDQVSGAATVSPAIQLAFSANPNPVLDLTSTTLTAAFQDSNSKFSTNLNTLVNLPVVFSNPINGTLSNETTVTGPTASATATFTPNSSPTAQATVQIDNAIVTVPGTIQVSDFSVSGSPSMQSVNVGTASAGFAIIVAAVNGFSGTVGLAITNSSGLSASLSQSSVTGSGNVTLTVQTGSAAPGTYSIAVTGTSGNITHQVNLQLTIADFSVSISPASQSVVSGTNALYTVTVSSSSGFIGPITLSVTGLPSGSFVFSANVVNLSGQYTSATSTLTANLAVFGNYPITVIGTSGNAARQGTAQLIVDDLAVSVSPASQSVTVGSSAVYSVTVSSSTGLSGPVTLSVNGLTSGTFSFSTNVVNLSGQSHSATSQLTVSEGFGSYNFTVQATSSTGGARVASIQLAVLQIYLTTTTCQNSSSGTNWNGGSCGSTIISNPTGFQVNLTSGGIGPFTVGYSKCATIPAMSSCSAPVFINQQEGVCNPITGVCTAGSGTISVTGTFATNPVLRVTGSASVTARYCLTYQGATYCSH